MSRDGYRLSNDGHDFLKAIRSDGVWSQTKKIVAESGGNATLELIKTLATSFLKKEIEDRTGLKL